MSQATRNNMRNTRIGNIATMDWSHLGIEIFQINQYQLRFVQGDRRVDYYPTSGKYFDINNNKWGTSTVADLPKFFKKKTKQQQKL